METESNRDNRSRVDPAMTQPQKPDSTPEKVFVNNEDVAIFRCPACGLTKTANVGRYKKANGAVKVNYKCSCGNARTVLLERRGAFRKKVEFSGTFLLEGKGIGGLMTVVDISKTGLRIRMSLKHNIQVGEKLMLEFQLDNAQKSRIRREVVVKHVINDYQMGVAFLSTDHYDDLGSFLLYETH
jgi:hypothetical protein